ncbi:heme-binding protein [Pikeienuella sp. HZG-20]|uniref:heme-binding protein n=1 Tax=Paludibacillus litoralis TaxID=3133267 RepID=UPI0030EE2B0F
MKSLSRVFRYAFAAALTAGLLVGCGGSETGSDDGATPAPGTKFTGRIDFPPLMNLTSADVQRVIAQAVNEADAQGAPATIAVVDRVGNVLAVFAMNGAPTTLSAIAEVPRTISQGPLSGTRLTGAKGSGLDGLNIPGAAAVGAIAKAVTGAYLSSSGNAFTTRTASQIVQENFNPGETFQPGGPLFGVQFSQLPCSDLSTRFASDNGAGAIVGSTVGPRRSPLGLAADPGGMPLYKNGVLVGGVGVIADGVYGLDLSVTDIDSDDDMRDELIALAATSGFEPPERIKAFNITLEGNTLRYTDTTDDTDRLRANPAAAPSFGAILGSAGALVPVTGYYRTPTGGAADVLPGTQYGTPASGVMPASDLPGGGPYQNPNAFVLVNAAGAPRFPPKAGSDAPGGDPAKALKRAEVIRLVDEALGAALAGRAQIRKPLNSRIQVSVSIVDTNGEILAVARTPDGPIFGTDVSLQKARTAMFFSSRTAGAELNAVGGAVVQVPDPLNGGAPQAVTIPPLSDYVRAMRRFVAPDALTGKNAFSDRGNGNLARPFYPDGVQRQQNGTLSPHGPLSRPFNSADPTENWSPFSTGIQFDLIGGNILEHVFYILGLGQDTAVGCSGLAPRDGLVFPRPPLANGAQIFAGSVPIYRGGVLIGGIGVSGDGIEQDDMVSALSLRRAGLALGGGLGHAPEAVRSDTLIPREGNGNRLRYVSCPPGPFINSNVQNPCRVL